MWRIENPELRPATLDFTSSDQGWRQVTQLFVDGIQLINALELIEWDEEETLFLVCEQCGFTHCKQGDWVRVRRSESMVLILPSFEFLTPLLDDDQVEFSPPRYLRERGIACIDRSTYESLRAQHSSFPPFEQIRELNDQEASGA